MVVWGNRKTAGMSKSWPWGFGVSQVAGKLFEVCPGHHQWVFWGVGAGARGAKPHPGIKLLRQTAQNMQ